MNKKNCDGLLYQNYQPIFLYLVIFFLTMSPINLWAQDDKRIKSEDKKIINLSMFPAVSPLLLKQRFERLAKEIGESIGHPVAFKTRKNYSLYFDAVENEEFDIVIISSFDFVRLREKTNYIPILSRSDKTIAMLVTTDLSVENIKNLGGQNIGFSPELSGAAILGRYTLAKNGMPPDSYHPVYFDNHLSCVLAMINKKINFCFISEKLLTEVSVNKTLDIKILLKSSEVPKQLILIHPRIRDKMEEISDVFLSLEKTERGRNILLETYLFELSEFDNDLYDENQEILDYLKGH